ncbi:MAG: hypothetical protein ACTHNH_13830 [Mesorhizobium sp.]
MADFVAVLKKTIDGMGETTPQMRERVYDKARSTIAAKLAAIVPPPPQEVAERQKRTLEDAIASVEKSYAKPAPPPASDPLAELENIFSSIDRNRNTPSHVRPAPSSAKAAAEPVRQVPPPPAAPTAAPAAFDGQPSKVAQPTPPPAAKAAPPKAPAADKPAPAVTAEPPVFEPEPRNEEFSTHHLPGGSGDLFQEPARPRRWGRLTAAVAALVVVAGAAYGVWLNGDAFKGMIGGDEAKPQAVKVEPLAPAKQTAEAEKPAATPPETSEPPAAAPEAVDKPKFTQRLTPEGKEIDPGPAGGESSIGEGTSVVALTTQPSGQTPADQPAEAATPESNASAADPATTPATENAPAPEATQPALAVGQKAIFYEERTSTAEGSAEPGNIVWSLVQESPGGEAPPEPAIRAEANIPGKNIQLRMTIRRNTDETLPASHIVELIFLTPEGFEGGGIDNILRIAMKTSEQDAGSPLIGIPAKIADGFFLVALNDTKADENANLTLLRNQDWIDIPVVYKSGRRALLTMEKGIPGEKVFDEALKAWQAKSSG